MMCTLYCLLWRYFLSSAFTYAHHLAFYGIYFLRSSDGKIFSLRWRKLKKYRTHRRTRDITISIRYWRVGTGEYWYQYRQFDKKMEPCLYRTSKDSFRVLRERTVVLECTIKYFYKFQQYDIGLYKSVRITFFRFLSSISQPSPIR